MGKGYVDCSDADLLRAAKTDPVAFGELYDRHAGSVCDRLRRGAPHLAADLTAETFAATWLSRRRFRDDRDGSALPWLLGIAKNVLSQSLRRDRAETRARERLGLPTDLATDDDYARVDEQLSPGQDLADAFEHLPAHERRALELRVLDELPYGEVARVLTIKPAAARLRVSRGLRRLSRSLGADAEQIPTIPALGSRREET
jgi:RNA polymerase sigma factor (sigma-70 family)